MLLETTRHPLERTLTSPVHREVDVQKKLAKLSTDQRIYLEEVLPKFLTGDDSGFGTGLFEDEHLPLVQKTDFVPPLSSLNKPRLAILNLREPRKGRSRRWSVDDLGNISYSG